MKRYAIVIFLAAIFLLHGNQINMASAGEPSKRGIADSAGTIPDDLKGVEIKDYFIELDAKPVGKIIKAENHVVVIHKNTGQAYFAAKNDPIYGNDEFYTLKDSRCRIGFMTADIITMGENTVISADEIVDDREGEKKKSAFSMMKGKAMFYAMRLFRYKSIDTSVKTRTAVMGVRGTKFGVEVVPGTAKTGESKGILVADRSGSGFDLLAQAGEQGGSSGYTRLIVFAGKLFCVRADGKLVEVEAGNTALFGMKEHKLYGTEREEVKIFLKAVGAEALFDGKGKGGDDGKGKGEGDGDRFDADIDEILDKLMEDGFIIDAEPEEEQGFTPMRTLPSLDQYN